VIGKKIHNEVLNEPYSSPQFSGNKIEKNTFARHVACSLTEEMYTGTVKSVGLKR